MVHDISETQCSWCPASDPKASSVTAFHLFPLSSLFRGSLEPSQQDLYYFPLLCWQINHATSGILFSKDEENARTGHLHIFIGLLSFELIKLLMITAEWKTCLNNCEYGFVKIIKNSNFWEPNHQKLEVCGMVLFNTCLCQSYAQAQCFWIVSYMAHLCLCLMGVGPHQPNLLVSFSNKDW